MSQLYTLVYVSTATRILSPGDLNELVLRGRARNVQHDVTALLIYDSGNFMQCIEGPSQGLATVYAHIRNSPLHRGIIELLMATIPVREFPDLPLDE